MVKRAGVFLRFEGERKSHLVHTSGTWFTLLSHLARTVEIPPNRCRQAKATVIEIRCPAKRFHT